MKNTLILLVLCLLLNGCASTAHLSDEYCQKISKVYINEDVKIPVKASYWGGNPVATGLFGPIGFLVSQETVKKEREEQIDDFMEGNDINIGEICINVAKSILMQNEKLSTKMLVNNPDDADTYLTLEVEIYGLGQEGPMTSNYVPMLNIKATLTDREGVVLWKGYGYIHPMKSGMFAMPFDNYFDNPSILKDRFTRAAEKIFFSMSEKL